VKIRFSKLALVLLFALEFIFAQNIDLLKSAIPYRKGNLWGFANPETKQILVPPVYDSVAFPLFSGLPPLVFKNGKCGLFAFYKNKDSLETLIPMGQERILKTLDEQYIVKNELGIQFLSSDGIPLLDDYFESFVYNEQLLFHRSGNHPDVLWERKKALVDSVFKINKIPTSREKYEIKRGIMPLLAFERKPRTDIPDDGKIYVTADVPETHDDILDFVFTNPKGEIYVLTKKTKKFILIEPVDFPKYSSVFPNYKAIFQSSINTSPMLKSDWQTDDFLTDKVFKTESKVKFKATNRYFKTVRLSQNKNNTRFGLIRKMNSNQHLGLMLPPIYKEINIYQFPYTRDDFIFELILENGTKQLFRNNEIMNLEPMDSFLYYFDCIVMEKNGLKGVGFLDFKTRNYTFFPPKYQEILVEDQRNFDYKKVILPNGVDYYISKSGFEFFEE
jgi:hypothetical protein